MWPNRDMANFTWLPLLQGLGLSAGLIIAIGAQNAFVLRQGLKHRHMFATAGVSSLADALLITAGIAGLGTIIAGSVVLTGLATWGGAIFLLYYGARSFKAALAPANASGLVVETGRQPSTTLYGSVLAAIGFSLLNPHAYLDTVVLIGSVGAKYPDSERILFGVGAVTASFVWFFGLVYGAARLSKLFERPSVWRILDVIIGCIMWAIAASLIWEPVRNLLV